jgi:NitT/TauT family transport system substrate-binding protein
VRISWPTLLFGLVLATSALAQDKPEVSTVRLAVGGQAALYYLPLAVTQGLGLFRQQGLEVNISDFAGGSRALQALIGGSADVVAGAFDHTIQMQAKNQAVVAVVELGQFPGFVLALLNSKASSYHGPADLKGMRIGVTAPGSSTHFMALQLMTKAGLKADDASFVGVGATTTAVAAVKRGEIDAIVNTDPAVALLQRDGLIKVIADTRTRDGTRDVYGGIYPAAVIYTTPAFIEKNPRTVQALINAFVRGLAWMQQPHARGDRCRRSRGLRTWRQAALHSSHQEQLADVLARRPLHPRRRRNRATRAQGIRPGCARRKDQPRRGLYGTVRRQGAGCQLKLVDLQTQASDERGPFGRFAIDVSVVLGGGGRE